jgi:hypothetical protein
LIENIHLQSGFMTLTLSAKRGRVTTYCHVIGD